MSEDAAAGFAAMMSGAAELATQDAPGADPEAPYGWTIDRATGQRRPKKSPGRSGKPPLTPSVESLKAPEPAAPG